jgi:hypothetical protein
VPRAKQPGDETARVAVRVRPSARRSIVTGYDGEAVEIQLAAQPIENRANVELVRVLSQAFDVPKSHVRIVRGLTGRNKVVDIDVTRETLQVWLSALPTKGTEG